MEEFGLSWEQVEKLRLGQWVVTWEAGFSQLENLTLSTF